MTVDSTGGMVMAAKALIPRARRAFQLSGVRDDELVSALARIAYATVHELRGLGLATDGHEALRRLREVLRRMETEARSKWTVHEKNKFLSAVNEFIERTDRHLKRETLRKLQNGATTTTRWRGRAVSFGDSYGGGDPTGSWTAFTPAARP